MLNIRSEYRLYQGENIHHFNEYNDENGPLFRSGKYRIHWLRSESNFKGIPNYISSYLSNEIKIEDDKLINTLDYKASSCQYFYLENEPLFTFHSFTRHELDTGEPVFTYENCVMINPLLLKTFRLMVDNITMMFKTIWIRDYEKSQLIFRSNNISLEIQTGNTFVLTRRYRISYQHDGYLLPTFIWLITTGSDKEKVKKLEPYKIMYNGKFILKRNCDLSLGNIQNLDLTISDKFAQVMDQLRTTPKTNIFPGGIETQKLENDLNSTIFS